MNSDSDNTKQDTENLIPQSTPNTSNTLSNTQSKVDKSFEGLKIAIITNIKGRIGDFITLIIEYIINYVKGINTINNIDNNNTNKQIFIKVFISLKFQLLNLHYTLQRK